MVSTHRRAFGCQISKELGKAGATLTMCSSISRGANYAIGKKGKTHSQRFGATNIQGVTKFRRQMAETYRHINKLIDNSGHHFDGKTRDQRSYEAIHKERKKVINIDPGDTSRPLQSIISFAINNGYSAREVGGLIIKIASNSAFVGNTSHAIYSIRKSRITARTKEIALEHSAKNVRLSNLALSSIFALGSFSSETISETEKTTLENSRKMAGDPRELATIVASESTVNYAFAIHNTIVAHGGTVKQ
jgi:NADP-dependent 3-hydroxy acid dehydrogenase YdfG